jgi:AhpD family alkylhydroperoxidase
MPNDVLSEKERALISLAASVGSGCRPCTEHHVKSVRAAGACERSVRLAVETALTGRTSATAAMAEWAEGCQGSTPEVDREFRAGKRLVTELMSIATAVAVNSAPDLEPHLATAQQSGATAEQIRSAIRIARQIQRVAQEKVEAITNRLEEQVSLNARITATPCCGPEPTGSPRSATGTTASCCRK